MDEEIADGFNDLISTQYNSAEVFLGQTGYDACVERTYARAIFLKSVSGFIAVVSLSLLVTMVPVVIWLFRWSLK